MASQVWWLSKTGSPSRCSRSTSQATGSPTSGAYATRTSSARGQPADLPIVETFQKVETFQWNGGVNFPQSCERPIADQIIVTARQLSESPNPDSCGHLNTDGP